MQAVDILCVFLIAKSASRSQRSRPAEKKNFSFVVGYSKMNKSVSSSFRKHCKLMKYATPLLIVFALRLFKVYQP